MPRTKSKQKKRKSSKRKSKRQSSKRKSKRSLNKTTVKKIYVDKIMTDNEISKREGEYFDESHYTKSGSYGILDTDVDVYTKQGELLLKLRKGVIPKNITNKALQAFRKQSKVLHDNRGASGGILDSDKLPSYVAKRVSPGRFRTNFIKKSDHTKSKTLTSNLAPSNIVGFYDKPDRNFVDSPPCRLTAFTRDNPVLWEDSLPFIKKCDRLFKKLVPKRYRQQKKEADKINDFRIDNTSFTTMTINYSWRTACHKDAGDLDEGFGNLVVIEDDTNPHTYKGCYLGFPQYGICVDVRQGDFLAMNVHEWHCNTEFNDQGHSTSALKSKIVKNKWYFNRLSMVLYLRKNMLRCQGLDIKNIKPKMSRLQYKQTANTKY